MSGKRSVGISDPVTIGGPQSFLLLPVRKHLDVKTLDWIRCCIRCRCLLVGAIPDPHWTGTSLVVWWLRLSIPIAGGQGLIPGQGTRSCMVQLRPSAPSKQINILKNKNVSTLNKMAPFTVAHCEREKFLAPFIWKWKPVLQQLSKVVVFVNH